MIISSIFAKQPGDHAKWQRDLMEVETIWEGVKRFQCDKTTANGASLLTTSRLSNLCLRRSAISQNEYLLSA